MVGGLAGGRVHEQSLELAFHLHRGGRGAESLGHWRHVERDVVEAYRRSGSEEPLRSMTIGLMSDSDNTCGRTVTYLDGLRLSSSPLQVPARAELPAGAQPVTTGE